MSAMTAYQRRAVEAVTDAIHELGGEVQFHQASTGGDFLRGTATCSRGQISVDLNEDDFVATIEVGGAERLFERPDFDSERAMIEALCEALQTEIALGPYPFFAPAPKGEG
jgi:hypothetical protein